MKTKEFPSVLEKEFNPWWFDKGKIREDYKVLEVESHIGMLDCVESAMRFASGEEWFDGRKTVFFECSRGEVVSSVSKHFGGSRICSLVGHKDLAAKRLYEASKEIDEEYFAYGMFELSPQEILGLHSWLFGNPNALLFFVEDSFKSSGELSDSLLSVLTGKHRGVRTNIPELLNISSYFHVSGIGFGDGHDEYEGFFFNLYKSKK